MKKVFVLSEVRGFTLMEILIVVALLVALAVALLITLNPWTQINKGQDSKRKTELTQLGKSFEDYYNDKNCYPRPQEVCYDYNPSAPLNCHICGSESASPSFSPYLSTLPCDPRQPIKKYLYQTDSSTCPSYYRVYAFLTNTTDPATQEYCSADGSGETDYNWGVASPNTQPSINCIEVTSTPAPTIPPTPTPTPASSTPTPTLTPAPGDYYCQGYQNCSSFDNTIWNCSPTFLDPFCTGSNGCTTQIGTCIKK